MTPGELIVNMSHEAVYLMNDEEGIAIRSAPRPDGKTYGRFPGKKEYVFGERSKVVLNAILAGHIITKEEYLNF